MLAFFVERIVFLVGGDHLLALHIRKARLKLLQRRAEQFAQQLFGPALGVHFAQRRQARRRFDVQVQDVAGGAQRALGAVFPMLG